MQVEKQTRRRYSGKTILLFSLVVLIPAFFTLSGSPPKKKSEPPQKVKAGLIARIVDYCNWPPDSPVSDTSTPFVLGSLGKNDIFDHLSDHIKKRAVGGKEAKIVYLKRDDDFSSLGINVLFIPKSERKRLEEILKKLEGKSILTFGDTKDFEQRGVMVNFFSDKNRIRFYVNRTSARKNNLDFRSEFLKYAKEVL